MSRFSMVKRRGTLRARRSKLVALAGGLALGSILLWTNPRPAPGALAALTGGGKPAKGATGGDVYSEDDGVIHHQQVICDPDGAQFGSSTITYDPTQVSLASVYQLQPDQQAGSPTYYVTGGYVNVAVGSQTEAQSLSSYFSSPAGPETGSVQVNWTVTSNSGAQFYFGAAPDSLTGYTNDGTFGQATPGEGGDNTFGVQFNYLEDPDDPTTYGVDEGAGGVPIYEGSGDTSPDSYEGEDADGDSYTFDDTDTTDASDTVEDAPEPASASLAAVAALGLLARRRRRCHGSRATN